MRIKRGPATRHKRLKIKKANKGYRMSRRKLTKVAKESYLHAGEYAFHGRKLRKRQFRTLWIMRISEAVKKEDMSYSRFIRALKDADIALDRKILAGFITEHPDTFKAIVEKAKAHVK